MAYSVHTGNAWETLVDTNRQSTEKKKKKKKKSKKKKQQQQGTDTTGDSIARGQFQGIASGTVGSAELADFVEPKKNLRQKKRRENNNKDKERKEDAPAKSAANGASKKDHEKHVSFGDAPRKTSPERRRRSSLKPSELTEQMDAGVVKVLKGMGYKVSEIVDCMDDMRKNKLPVTEAADVLEQLQMRAQDAMVALSRQDSEEPPLSKLGKNVLAHPTSPIVSKKGKQAFRPPVSPDAPQLRELNVPGRSSNGPSQSGKKKKNNNKPSASLKQAVVENAESSKTKKSDKKSNKKNVKGGDSEEDTSSSDAQLNGSAAGHDEKDRPMTPRERLEHQARNFDPRSSMVVLEHWVDQLNQYTAGLRRSRKSGAQPAGHLFVKTFVESQALELLCEQILKGKLSRCGNKTERLLRRLLQLTLSPRGANVHDWLLEELRTLSIAIVRADNEPDLMAKVLAVITKQKHVVLAELTAGVAKSAAPPKKIPPAGANEDPLTSQQNRAARTENAVAMRAELVASARRALDQVGSQADVSQQHAFTAKELRARMDSATRSTANTEQERKQLTARQLRLDEEKNSSLKGLMATDKRFDTEKMALQERKKLLEAELQQIDSSLRNLQQAQDQNALKMQALTDHYASNTKKVRNAHDQLRFDLAKANKEQMACKEVLGFLDRAHRKLTDASAASRNVICQEYHGVTSHFLRDLQDYITEHQKLVKLLRDRIQFCTNKLRRTRDERRSVEQLALQQVSQKEPELEAQMEQMISTDTVAANKVVKDVEDQLRRVAKLVDPGLSAARASGYTAFLEFLQTCAKDDILPFDTSMLPKVSVNKNRPVPEPKKVVAMDAPARPRRQGGKHGPIGSPKKSRTAANNGLHHPDQSPPPGFSNQFVDALQDARQTITAPSSTSTSTSASPPPTAASSSAHGQRGGRGGRGRRGPMRGRGPMRRQAGNGASFSSSPRDVMEFSTMGRVVSPLPSSSSPPPPAVVQPVSAPPAAAHAVAPSQGQRAANKPPRGWGSSPRQSAAASPTNLVDFPAFGGDKPPTSVSPSTIVPSVSSSSHGSSPPTVPPGFEQVAADLQRSASGGSTGSSGFAVPAQSPTGPAPPTEQQQKPRAKRGPMRRSKPSA